MKTQILKNSLSIVLISFTSLSFALGAKKPKDNSLNTFEQNSLSRFAARAGVEALTLRGFFDKIQHSSAAGRVSRSEVANCFNNFSDSNASRTQTLKCLSAFGRSALNEGLMFEIQQASAPRYAKQASAQAARSLFLLGFLGDLVRQNRIHQQLPAAWFDLNDGFAKESEQKAFNYENGDIILGMGNTSVSSLISQVTEPQSRFSHAFLMKKPGSAAPTTLEALVETGVKEFPAKHFEEDPYNELWVMRWSDKARRAAVSRRAVEWATGHAQNKTPYDFSFNVSDNSGIFCSELVVGALAFAGNMSVGELLPFQSKIRSEAVYNFSNRIGLESRTVPSPSDLSGSKHLKLLSKYRNTKDLSRQWTLIMFGDVFVDRLDRGADFDASPEFMVAPLPFYVLQLFPRLLHDEARLIPANIGPGKIAVMATTELQLFRPAVKFYQAHTKSHEDLLAVSPWRTHATFEYWFENSAGGRRHLKIKN